MVNLEHVIAKWERQCIFVTDSFMSLQQFQTWLENRVKAYHNPIANVLASEVTHKNKGNFNSECP